MDVNDRHGHRTLLASVLLSAPGPLVLGLGLVVGQSTTQIADFVRRTVELAATLVSLWVFRSIKGLPPSDERRIRLERRVDFYVGMAMLISALAMAYLTVIGLIYQVEKGNVIPALIIAVLGVISNGIMAVNYRAANAKAPSGILKAQGALYRTKTLVDGCVSCALIIVIFSGGMVRTWADFAGGMIVTMVLLYNGVKMLRKRFV